jgi:hypothetical protein
VPEAAALEGRHDVVGVVDDEAANVGRARLAEHDFVIELGPDRHGEIAQPHELRPPCLVLAERARHAALRECLGGAPRKGEHPPSGGRDLVVALAGLEVLLMNLGPRG